MCQTSFQKNIDYELVPIIPVLIKTSGEVKFSYMQCGGVCEFEEEGFNLIIW